MKQAYKNVIIGAGLTGLSTGFYLKKDYLLVESQENCGGAFNSISKDGYILDLGERFIRIPADKRRLFHEIFGGNFFNRQELVSQVHLRNKRIDYPFQCNLYDLDGGLRERCLKGLSFAQKNIHKKAKINQTFYDWIMSNFGKGIAELFMLPYNKKIWGVDPVMMSSDWFFNQQVVPKVELVREEAKGPVKNGRCDKSIRYYPQHGGAVRVPEFIANQLKGDIAYNSRVTKIDIKNKLIRILGGNTISYQRLVSTIPLNELVDIADPLPVSIKGAALQLAHNSVICIWVAVKGSINEKAHWIYFPEKKYRFARLYFPANFSNDLAPHGHSVVGAIITFRKSLGKIELIEKQLIKQLIEMEVIKKTQKIEFVSHKILPYGFCLPLINTKPLVGKIRKCLAKHDVYSVGRYGEWKYAGMEHALEDGKRIALQLH